MPLSTLSAFSAKNVKNVKKMSRLHRLRKLAYAPLVAAVAAGAICTGAGASTAAPDMTPGPTTDTPQSGSTFHWTLENRTGQPVYGEWNAHYDQYAAHSSHVESSPEHRWQIGAVVGADNYQDFWHEAPDWDGHICYNNHWWDLPRIEARTYSFRLEVDSKGTLFANYVDTWDLQRLPMISKKDAC
ncbi:hypothetical protein [Rhodococcus jostii]|uniref:hypothetical protein n=1 Tax=Rhodococcus jostii TaxID=132919 RepID=UPI0036448F40